MIHDLKPYPAYKDSGVLPKNAATNSFIKLGIEDFF
jgi:hypothetical protein